MKICYNVTGARRRELARVISGITGDRVVYKGVPTCAYEIGPFTLTRDGTLEFRDGTGGVSEVLAAIARAGFETADPAPAEKPESVEPIGLTVSVPLEHVAVENLTRLLEAKGSLIRKALGVDALPVEVGENAVSFPWFAEQPEPEEAKACTHLITALCRMSKEQKRVTAMARDVDNEKYAFRCFLLRLGFIGPEYKEERKILLRNLTGSSAFRDGSRPA